MAQIGEIQPTEDHWKSQLGIQTILWGEDFEEGLEVTLRTIRQFGFTGVEFFQVPAKLEPAEQLEELLQENGLVLLGLAGGSLKRRLEYSRKLSMKPLYLYIQQWEDDEAKQAIDEGHTLALHPHHYTHVNNCERALKELKKAEKAIGVFGASRVFLLPDTAHLYLSKDDFLEVVTQNESRVKVIHLKDWSPQFGWSRFTYARGFTALGTGIVPLRPIWDWVRVWLKKNPKNWVVVEQDSTDIDPSQCIKTSLDWLSGQTDNTTPTRLSIEHHRSYLRQVRVFPKDSPHVVEATIAIMSSLARESSNGVDRIYSTLLSRLGKLLHCICGMLWEISPREDTAILRSLWQPTDAPALSVHSTVLRVSTTLIGSTVSERTMKVFNNLGNLNGIGTFLDQKLLTDFGLTSFISIPIPNRWNQNQPEILIQLFPYSAESVTSGSALMPEYEYSLQTLKPIIQSAIEHAWENVCGQVLNLTNWKAGESNSVSHFLNSILDPIKSTLHCRTAEIYLLDDSRTRMELRAPKSGKDAVLQPVAPEESYMALVWANRTPMNSGVMPLDAAKRPACSSLLLPIYRYTPPLGNVMGIIRCKDKVSDTLHKDFTPTDEILLDAFQSSLAPHLDRLLAEERRGITMSRITHELKMPLTVVRGATWYAKKEMNERGLHFSEDYIGDIRNYLFLMEQVVARAGVFKLQDGVPLNRTSVLLFEDVIIPTIDYLKVDLDQRGFPRESIHFDGLRSMPPVYVDKARFQQVIFNLLGNAIKYAHTDPRLFKVSIRATFDGAEARLAVQDWGTGIPLGMEEEIFLEGIRGPNAFELDVLGDGLGCWVIREILHAHHATIKVTRRASPTEFTIFLPRELGVLPTTNRRQARPVPESL